jgi:hypothetical protein
MKMDESTGYIGPDSSRISGMIMTCNRVSSSSSIIALENSERLY